MKLKMQKINKKKLFNIIGNLLGINKHPDESYEEFRKRLLEEHTKNPYAIISDNPKNNNKIIKIKSKKQFDKIMGKSSKLLVLQNKAWQKAKMPNKNDIEIKRMPSIKVIPIEDQIQEVKFLNGKSKYLIKKNKIKRCKI